MDATRGKEPYVGRALAEATMAIVFGSWWMLREIELAALTVDKVWFESGEGCGIACVKVSASKVDPMAAGVTRKHGCACPSPLCPVWTARRLVASRAGAAGCEPLVTGIRGGTVSKAEVIDELRGFSSWLGDTGAVFSGHSMRVTSAQRLAWLGSARARSRCSADGHRRRCLSTHGKRCWGGKG